MNVIKMMGGLGNQLFQYSFGKAQESNGIEVRYLTTWFEYIQRRSANPRPYRLDMFKVNVVNSLFLKTQSLIKEDGFDINLLKTDNHNFHGYWQYLAYHENNLPILRKEFCVQEKHHTKEFLELMYQILEKPSVSVHVRKGDYVGNKGLNDLPLSYYMEAVKLVKGDLYIFSDDINWCKHNLKSVYFSRKINFIHLQDYLDFELMKFCNHNIISGSTFSWWAAMLNENPEKIVVAPSGWISGANKQDDALYYPKAWIKI
jgi:hypothetical protein